MFHFELTSIPPPHHLPAKNMLTLKHEHPNDQNSPKRKGIVSKHAKKIEQELLKSTLKKHVALVQHKQCYYSQ